jgi:hypothetical protein
MAENSPVAGKILIEEEKYKKLKKFHQIFSQSRVSCKVLIDIASYKKLLDALKFKEDFERIVPELGFYIVSDGTDRPYRVRCRPPCFPPMAALPRMIEGEMVADIVPTFGSINMIAGELDR